MSVKGEQGGSGGGVRNEGEKCEHVNPRGRLMCAQRVEFSIRLFPLSSFLSYTLFSLEPGRCHSITLPFFLAVNPELLLSFGLFYLWAYRSYNRSSFQTQAVPRLFYWEVWGVFLTRNQGVILKHLLKKRKCTKGRADRQGTKGIRVDKGWRGSG